MEIFDEIFANILFYRVSGTSEYTSYMAKITSYENYMKYIVLVVRNEYAHAPQTTYIQNIKWVSVQTRLIDQNYDIPEQTVDHKTFDPRYFDKKVRLSVKDRNEERTSYVSMLPIELILLHNLRKKSVYQYADTMDIRQALATFNCVIKKL